METTARCQLFAPADKDQWNAYIHGSLHYDFYHTADYHLLEGGNNAFLFVYQDGDRYIAIPLIKRVIPDSDYFDCTSVYGYTGPVCNKDFAELDKTFITDFLKEFVAFLKEERIISIFTRLHPLSNQSLLLPPTVKLVGRTVAVDLQQSLDEQRAQYRRPIRMKINQLRKKGFEVKVDHSLEQVAVFGEIYRENMKKVNAAEHYLYSDAYFKQFLQAEDYHAKLLLVEYEGEIAAGAIATFTNKVVQLHLAGTASRFFKDSPMKLIYDEACLLGRAEGMHYMHLGSGVGGKEDSLFHFKTGFSDCFFDFNTWNYIADPSIYEELVNQRLKEKVATEDNTDLFPLYRFI